MTIVCHILGHFKWHDSFIMVATIIIEIIIVVVGGGIISVSAGNWKNVLQINENTSVIVPESGKGKKREKNQPRDRQTLSN